ncbi:hypothetical protein [Geminocystis herdmanii]|uniref:hypothetical protein n=1 Tax=Geminocystis herdmanii TaxID=669359 RepID=UPI0003459D9A|nr:hypothetical protein [Geminocystis herdmanii]
MSKLKLKGNTKKKVSFDYEEQSISIEDFLTLRDSVLSVKDTHPLREKNRKFWLWVYSIQLIYGLRIAEVAAIKNLTIDYIPANDSQENSKDKTIFKALSNPDNKENIIYIGNFTLWRKHRVRVMRGSEKLKAILSNSFSLFSSLTVKSLFSSQMISFTNMLINNHLTNIK